MKNYENKIKINPTFHHQLKGNGKWKKELDEKYMKYRRKWTDNPTEYILETGPIHLDIETSSICNLRCPMCFYTVDSNRIQEEQQIVHGLMSLERFKKIIDEASLIGVSSIKLNWRGEPLMNPDIFEMIRYAKSKGIIDIMMNTNATKLTEEVSEKLINAGLDKIFFSVDSIIKERYEKIRVGGMYNETIQNIKRFCEINERKGHTVYTRVQKVLLNETNDENKDYVKMFSKFIDQIAFEDYIPYGNLSFGKNIEKNEDIKFSCAMLWQRLVISWDGQYMMCCSNSDKAVFFGNNDEESIAEFWNGEKMSFIRNCHQEGRWKDIALCKQCYIPYM